ncbi:MAG TPA: flagellar motor protein MotA, partial [Beijerinckia sp.]|nr:flagellar motor protein MotA [Beijerinckia sp.]
MADDRLKLSSPRIFLVRMLVFLILTGFIALILYRQIAIAFMANPGLNGLIAGLLLIGIVLGLRQVVRLFREVHWVNALTRGQKDKVKPPILLAPMATLLGEKPFGAPISTLTLRAILDSVGTRLDEARDIARYLTGLLIFLGLLGTFWGLLETVGSIGGVIKSMQTGSDATVMFDDLKNGLSAPLAGMSISFTSSLFGLAGSLVLGFL